MHDFPPVVPAFDDAPTPAAGGRGAPRLVRDGFRNPDTRSPARFLFWLMRQQRSTFVLLAGVMVVQWLPGAVGPWVVGQVIDTGITRGDPAAVARWCLLLLGMVLTGALCGVLSHTLVVRTWLVGMYGTTKLVTRKVTQLGHITPQRTPTGEVLSVASGDADQFGSLGETVANLVGAIVSYLVIAMLVLSTSPLLGVVVLVAAPVIVLAASPLLKPLQRAEERERTRSSELTSLATDIVAGLRILRGIGGERTFAANYTRQSRLTQLAGMSAGRWQAAVDASSVLFAGVFLLSLTWLGARQVASGGLSVGQLVSFFGYAVYMTWPIQAFFEAIQRWVTSLVSARKAIAVLEQQPPWPVLAEPLRLPATGDLHDRASGFTARHGELTMVVSAVPDDSAALADRLGRYLPGNAEPPSLEAEEGLKGRAARRSVEQRRAERARLAEQARQAAAEGWGVTLGRVDLGDVPLAQVRQRILVSDASSQVFAGTLQSLVDPHDRLTRQQAEQVLHVAAAEEVFEALPGGWQGVVDERGRGLSGGQRQRLVLARALGLDPDVLVLVEPTSAVDAHTEAAIAERLTAHRRGRTTVVSTVSPLLLHHADRVVLLVEGRAVAAGRHEQLLADSEAYRYVVARALDEEPPDGPSDGPTAYDRRQEVGR